MPSGKPTKNPTTGITKKPTPASTKPTTIERRGTPALRSCRPGTSNLRTWAPPITTDTTASTAQAVAEPTANAHTATAAQTSSAPGSAGTTTPTMPTAIATPTSRIPTSLTRHRLVAEAMAPAARPVRTSRCSRRSPGRLRHEHRPRAFRRTGYGVGAASRECERQLAKARKRTAALREGTHPEPGVEEYAGVQVAAG